MLNFENVESAMSAFVAGEIPPVSDSLTIAGVDYRYSVSSQIAYKHVLTGKADGFMVYTVHPGEKDKMAEAGLREWIALVYNQLKPKRLLVTSKARLKFKMNSLIESEQNVIGETVEVRFTNLPSSSVLKGKVDTGADICSLHCEGFEINKSTNRITFRCSHLSGNSMTVPLTDIQAVKTTDGVKNRPVIEMSVKIGDQVFENVKFNLKDRADMDTPVLIGQNLLDKGKFLIDPKQETTVNENDTSMEDELADMDHETLSSILAHLESGEDFPEDDMETEIDDLDDSDGPMNTDLEEPEEEEVEEPEDRSAQLDAAFQTLRASDITFAEILDYAANYNADEPDDTIEA